MKNPSKSLLRHTLAASAAAAGTAALLLTGVTGASAHVAATPDQSAANSYALVAFAIPHGCKEAATTKVTITLPAELDDAQPTVNPNWSVEKVVERLPEPKKLQDGTSITRRTTRIAYSAKDPLASELRDVLVLSAKLPDAAGKTLYFPTLQECEQGQIDWSQIPSDGQDAHSLQYPAPSVTVTEALPPGGPHGAPAAAAVGGSAVTARAAVVGDEGIRGWAGLVAGLGGLSLGGLALLRSRRAVPVPGGIPEPKD